MCRMVCAVQTHSESPGSASVLGVLKALSFLFEYIGEMGKDYVYAVAPLLEDALMDRDMVHRQTACATVKRKRSCPCGSYSFLTLHKQISVLVSKACRARMLLPTCSILCGPTYSRHRLM